MKDKFLFVYCFIVFTFSPSVFALDKQVVDVGLIVVDDYQTDMFRQQFQLFEKNNPDVVVRILTLKGDNYASLLKAVKEYTGQLDIIQWMAGNRLQQLAQQKLIVDMEDVWLKHQLFDEFSTGLTHEVSIANKPYAIPYTSYVWGFLYKKSVFKRLNMTPPKKWHELLALVVELKSAGITPIGIGSKYHWHAVGWFDYLVLRLHGAKFYQSLVAGKISYRSREVIQVFEHWQSLLVKDVLLSEHSRYEGMELLPLIYREKLGLTLIGSYTVNSLNESYQNEFGFFPFPQINENNQANFDVVAPVSVFTLTHIGEKNKHAKDLIAFLANSNTQAYMSEKSDMLPANKNSTYNDNAFALTLRDILQNADFVSQFFDREVTKYMAITGTKAITAFLTHQNINIVTNELERARIAGKPIVED